MPLGVFFFLLALSRQARFLREGWLGPTFDGADDQWRELRESLPLLLAAAAAHGLLSLLVRKTCPREEAPKVISTAPQHAISN